MKKFYFFGLAASLMLAVTALISGCSAEPETIYVKIPVLADRTVNIGDNGNFEFDAFDSWTLTSSADWCELSAVSGEAGKQSVGYTITNAGAAFGQSDVAELVLTVGTETSSFKFTRAALVRELKVYDKDGKEMSAIVLDSNGAEVVHADVTVKANFPWDLEQTTGWPEWLVKPGRLSPELDPETNLYTLSFTLEVALEQLNTRGTESELVFSDLNSATSTVKVPVRYFGVEPGFFLADCELGREITVTKDGFVCDKDGNPTDKNFIELDIIGGEGLKFIPLHITMSPEGEYISPFTTTKWNISCEEIVTRSTFEVKRYKVTFGTVPDVYEDNFSNRYIYLRAYFTLVSPSVYSNWSYLPETYWDTFASDTFLFVTGTSPDKKCSIRPGQESYVFTFNVKDALTE